VRTCPVTCRVLHKHDLMLCPEGHEVCGFESWIAYDTEMCNRHSRTPELHTTCSYAVATEDEIVSIHPSYANIAAVLERVDETRRNWRSDGRDILTLPYAVGL
jgi:hypothetical protein